MMASGWDFLNLSLPARPCWPPPPSPRLLPPLSVSASECTRLGVDFRRLAAATFCACLRQVETQRRLPLHPSRLWRTVKRRLLEEEKHFWAEAAESDDNEEALALRERVVCDVGVRFFLWFYFDAARKLAALAVAEADSESLEKPPPKRPSRRRAVPVDREWLEGTYGEILQLYRRRDWRFDCYVRQSCGECRPEEKPNAASTSQQQPQDSPQTRELRRQDEAAPSDAEQAEQLATLLSRLVSLRHEVKEDSQGLVETPSDSTATATSKKRRPSRGEEAKGRGERRTSSVELLVENEREREEQTPKGPLEKASPQQEETLELSEEASKEKEAALPTKEEGAAATDFLRNAANVAETKTLSETALPATPSEGASAAAAFFASEEEDFVIEISEYEDDDQDRRGRLQGCLLPNRVRRRESLGGEESQALLPSKGKRRRKKSVSQKREVLSERALSQPLQSPSASLEEEAFEVVPSSVEQKKEKESSASASPPPEEEGKAAVGNGVSALFGGGSGVEDLRRHLLSLENATSLPDAPLEEQGGGLTSADFSRRTSPLLSPLSCHRNSQGPPSQVEQPTAFPLQKPMYVRLKQQLSSVFQTSSPTSAGQEEPAEEIASAASFKTEPVPLTASPQKSPLFAVADRGAVVRRCIDTVDRCLEKLDKSAPKSLLPKPSRRAPPRPTPKVKARGCTALRPASRLRFKSPSSSQLPRIREGAGAAPGKTKSTSALPALRKERTAALASKKAVAAASVLQGKRRVESRGVRDTARPPAS